MVNLTQEPDIYDPESHEPRKPPTKKSSPSGGSARPSEAGHTSSRDTNYHRPQARSRHQPTPTEANEIDNLATAGANGASPLRYRPERR